MADPLTEDWEPAQVAVMEALRDWAVGFAELNQHMSTWMKLPTSDAHALGQIIWAAQGGEPLSPARLARRIGMTSGATTVLLNRLEQAQMLVRSREHTDRRRVTLRPTAAAQEQARAFMAAAGVEIAAVLRQTETEELDTAIAVLRRMNEAVGRANDRLGNATT
ncbi:MarR family winged helix-turn-helix transcriptional regulator [Streptomyces sp. NPDC057621]|uniref:MarR family winged helix-turn-helix transcriptional regulator n=1 Tax=Streptomyces TaxID=1883 RepID=UPI001FFCC5E2|nr:MarR family transcriptional regulator [Streptomyces liliiviolaceus]